jgi:hypothetical protein
MARSYRRDSNGRFSGGGGGGGSKPSSKGVRSGGGGAGSAGSKAAATKATNKARAAELSAKGTTAIGGRLKAKGFAGGAGAQKRAGGLRGTAVISGRAKAFTVGKGGKQSASQRSATKRALASIKKPAGIKKGRPSRTNKSAPSAAKQRYKELSSAARRSGPYRSGAENRTAAGARRSMQAMVRNRGTKNRVPKVAQAVARAAAATFTAGQVARRSVDRAMKGRKRR